MRAKTSIRKRQIRAKAFGYWVTSIALVSPTTALASNGLYLPGYGMESMMMGGADVAVARDAFAANNNPAGMMQTHHQAADAELAIWEWRQAAHTDAMNYRKPTPHTSAGVYGNAAYVSHDADSPFAFGGALIVQGGVGWSYSGLNTIFGNRDDASSLFTIIKFGPAAAWQVNERLSLGAMVALNYVAGTQELFPNTPGFPGFRFKGANGTELSYKLGLQYRVAPDVTLGMTYAPQTSVPMKNGNLRINVPGTGVVRYDNASLQGMRLPEEFSLGLSFRPWQPLLISLEGTRYGWANAINTLTINASSPRSPAAPPTQSISSTINMHNQNVWQFGAAWEYDETTSVMGGINYGRMPIDAQHINPVFVPIPQLHYMLGISRKLDKGWQASGGFELMPLQSVTYNHPLFSGTSNERHYGYMLHLGLGRNW